MVGKPTVVEIYLETERLRLCGWSDDYRAPFAAMNADPQVMQYFNSELSRAESDAFGDRIIKHFSDHGFGLFALERKSDGAFLGFAGFSSAPRNTPVEGETEIGWRLAREFWRQGFAYEAAAASLGWCWRQTELPRIVSFTSDLNEPSRKLMQKLGLAHRPKLDFNHPAIPPDDPLCHQVVYVIEREEGNHG